MYTEVLSDSEYEFEDLRYELSRDMGEPLSERTLWYWLENLRIHKDEYGFYHYSDLELLRAWVQNRNKFKTFKRFNQWRIKNYAS
ncbi:MAG: hypothetical protein AAF327_18085 [Cyanobacteria bacterium P01_A01_bin.37]